MTKQAKAKNGKPLVVEAKKEESDGEALARYSLRPSVKNAITILDFTGKCFGDIDLFGLVDELADQSKAANNGNMKRAEGMLMVQAHTLDTLFNNLARRAASSKYMTQFEPYMRLALKAQSQCRATLEALAAIKNPQHVAFVKQANIAQNQQVNNGPLEPTRARETENQPNELLTVQHGETLDTFGAGTAGGVGPAMAALEPIDRTKNGKG